MKCNNLFFQVLKNLVSIIIKILFSSNLKLLSSLISSLLQSWKPIMKEDGDG